MYSYIIHKHWSVVRKRNQCTVYGLRKRNCGDSRDPVSCKQSDINNLLQLLSCRVCNQRLGNFVINLARLGVSFIPIRNQFQLGLTNVSVIVETLREAFTVVEPCIVYLCLLRDISNRGYLITTSHPPPQSCQQSFDTCTSSQGYVNKGNYFWTYLGCRLQPLISELRILNLPLSCDTSF